MPSFVTYESFPIGAGVINDNERSQRYGYSGVVKGHETRSPVPRSGINRKGIVVLYTHNPAGATLVHPFEQQYLCDIKQGIVVTESKEALVFKLEQQINLVSVKDKMIEAQKQEIVQLKLEREQMNKLINHPPACIIDFGKVDMSYTAYCGEFPPISQDPLDKVGKFMVLGKENGDLYHTTRRIAEQKAEALAKQHPTHTMSVVQVMSDHTTQLVAQPQVKRYD